MSRVRKVRLVDGIIRDSHKVFVEQVANAIRLGLPVFSDGNSIGPITAFLPWGGPAVSYADMAGLLNMALGKPKTTDNGDGTYTHTFRPNVSGRRAQTERRIDTIARRLIEDALGGDGG